jgi:hypothetical protein
MHTFNVAYTLLRAAHGKLAVRLTFMYQINPETISNFDGGFRIFVERTTWAGWGKKKRK